MGDLPIFIPTTFPSSRSLILTSTPLPHSRTPPICTTHASTTNQTRTSTTENNLTKAGEIHVTSPLEILSVMTGSIGQTLRRTAWNFVARQRRGRWQRQAKDLLGARVGVEIGEEGEGKKERGVVARGVVEERLKRMEIQLEEGSRGGEALVVEARAVEEQVGSASSLGKADGEVGAVVVMEAKTVKEKAASRPRSKKERKQAGEPVSIETEAANVDVGIDTASEKKTRKGTADSDNGVVKAENDSDTGEKKTKSKRKASTKAKATPVKKKGGTKKEGKKAEEEKDNDEKPVKKKVTAKQTTKKTKKRVTRRKNDADEVEILPPTFSYLEVLKKEAEKKKQR